MNGRFDVGRVVTFGEVMLRLSPNGHRRFFQDDFFRATFGGAEANVAVSLARFNQDVSFVTKLPVHAIGEGAIYCLRGFGVDTSFIVRGGERVGIYYLEKGADQRSSECIYDRTGSAIALANNDDFDWDEIFKDAEWFHFTGITPALSNKLYEICLNACRIAKERGIKISCDLNYRSKLWTKDDARKKMTELCSYVSICVANEEDAANVFGIDAKGTDVHAGRIEKWGYEEIAKKLSDRFGFECVAFTLRTSHSASVNDWAGMLFDGRKNYYSKEYHIDSIVDRVGSGDSFSAGLIYGIMNGFEPQKTIDFAVAASCLKHSIEGDFNRVLVSEVEKLMNGNSSGRIQR